MAWNIEATVRDINSVAAPVPPPEGPARYALALVYSNDQYLLLDREKAEDTVKKMAARIAKEIYPGRKS